MGRPGRGSSPKLGPGVKDPTQCQALWTILRWGGMTKLAARGHEAAASFLVLSLVPLALALTLFAAAVFPAFSSADESGPTPPELTFSPAPLDFGKVTVGTETAMTTVTVHNAGTLGTAIDKVTIEGPEAGEFKLNGGCGWIEAGQDCYVSVAFKPGSSGGKEAALAIWPKETPAQTTPILGAGVAPQLAFAPGSYDFGIQRVNRGEGSTYVQLTNVGEAMTQIGSFGFAGKDPNNFWTNGGDCWNGRQLQPGESCGVQIVFNPWDMVAYEAELQAYANGGTFGATLTGFGGRPQVEPGANPTELGAVTVGAVGPVETILFTNHGNLPGNFFIGIVAGGDAGSFKLLDESCSLAPLAPAAACTAHVRFTPQGPGPKQARLALFGDDDGGTMALLGGEGVAAVATLAPGSFDFGVLAAGTRSAGRAFAVRNDGSAPLDLGAVGIVGADLDQFALAGDECSGETLVPGAECLVRIRFAPDSAGAKVAKLRVFSAGGAFVATLSGSGEGAVPGADDRDDGGFGHPDSPMPRLWRQGRTRRFVRGQTLNAGRLQRPRRAQVRASTSAR